MAIIKARPSTFEEDSEELGISTCSFASRTTHDGTPALPDSLRDIVLSAHSSIATRGP